MSLSHYLDIRPLPLEEATSAQVMGDVFLKVHLGLVSAGEGKIGISLPEHSISHVSGSVSAGNILRLHGSESALTKLMRHQELQAIKDYARMSPVSEVPEQNKRYRIVRRVQAKSSPARLYRRSVKKGWLSEEVAQAKSLKMTSEKLRCPYIQMRSSSTGQDHFRLFVQHGDLQVASRDGRFNSYGLALKNDDGAYPTVPWF